MRIPYYIRDKRVIPRLRWIPYFIQIVTLGMVAAAIVATFRLAIDESLLLGSAIAENTIVIGVCAVAYVLPMFGLPRFFAWLGVLTREQAEDFFATSKECEIPLDVISGIAD